ncbi:PAC2 family protein [Candidatus Woesearchaeota archaeon]|nr:PAC2 family protein [Candidatus Woesearchaeota archaeon]
MSTWKFEQVGKKPKLRSPILIEGLPGIGNVGKVAVDFLIDELNAKKVYDISSYTFPHSVFVNEKNLVELPKIEVFYKKFGKKKNDILFLAGDIQPIDEVSSYEFSDKMLELLEKFGGKEVITLGGIGLSDVPKHPKMYCTGSSKSIIDKYKNGANEKLYGVVGPIVGVTGLLVGMAKKRRMDAIAFLAETYGHPMYLGIKGAREMLKVLDKNLKLKIDIKKLDEEIKEVESDIVKRSGELAKVAKQTALKKLQRTIGKETSYIG